MAEPVPAPVIKRWEDIPEDLHAELKALVLAAARCHDPNLVSISEELTRKIAQRVFSCGWNTSMSLRPPAMQKMTLSLGAIIVGKFKEDLPPGSDKSTLWDTRWNPDDPRQRLASTPRSRPPQTPNARKQGKPAFFRPRLDINSQFIIHDFVDATGKLAPVDYIAFDNGSDQLTANDMLVAYLHADAGRERIAKDFNIALCVYLWQKTISNAVPPEGLPDYTADDFVRPALIGDEIERIAETMVEVAGHFEANPRRGSLC
ncbi:hypothetical protein BJ166DRAFT_579443 [Pestalotiopsis sp. NC0098]|nr:hypothetical protein BJ166DRAFT_579443 [Pestalotiopsis sp. NC0098]